MNEFEKRRQALRLQFKAEQVQITKDCLLAIGHINTAIGQVTTVEAREALRADKRRRFEEMRSTHEWNKRLYTQQLEMLEDEARLYYMEHPTKHAVRRALRLIHRHAQENGLDAIDLSFGENLRAKVDFK